MCSPKTLYTCTVSHIVRNFDKFRHQSGFRSLLTDSMRMDILHGLLHESKSCVSTRLALLRSELEELDMFLRLLRVGHRRVQLHAMFESVNSVLADGSSGKAVEMLSVSVARQMATRLETTLGAAEAGLNMASFLADAGWFVAAETVLQAVSRSNERSIRNAGHCRRARMVRVEAKTRLMHAYSAYCNFAAAEAVYNELRAEGDALGALNLAAVYSEFSTYCFMKSQYREAYDWSLKAVACLNADLPVRAVVDVLRQASKSCVVRRQFTRAEILIQEAVLLARETYGDDHPKLADCLVDYGFFLLNVDGVAKSVQAYERALKIRRKCFGQNNLLVAMANEELAYATYVHEYNTGHFEAARDSAEATLGIMSSLLPADHLLLASAKRVLALILEEIAIDNSDSKLESARMLADAEQLHKSAVVLAIAAFGETNVQTAKHYGNLGRLYQTMEKFDEAERMHLKAIEIKEKLLGKNDYEVALSIGHLASLYNYDLEDYGRAEALYLRSIDIGVRLFGPTYSGLEYDYRGLIRVYQETRDHDKVFDYSYKLRMWKDLRNAKEDDPNREPFLLNAADKRPQPIKFVVQCVGRADEDLSFARLRRSTSVSSTDSSMSLQ